MFRHDYWLMTLICACLLAVTGCGDDPAPQRDAGADAVGDAAVDVGPDAPADDADAAPDGGDGIAEYEAKFLIEHNAADQDTGFQIFFDWDAWQTLSVTGPGGDILEVTARGEMADFGLTELFFETAEPPADEVPRQQVLDRFGVGEYVFDAISVDGETLRATAMLTHDIPAATEITAPSEDAQVDPGQPLTVSWTSVTESLAGEEVDIEAYQLIVERDLDLGEGEGFTQLIYDVVVPAGVTSVPVPAEFLRPGTPYEIEVLTLEATGNQTISATSFETTGDPTDDLTEVPEPGPTELAAAKILIEHNATDQDTGYQLVLDGEPWNVATVEGPDGTGVIEVRAQGELATFGLTEMFVETNEPPADEVSLEQVLSLLPEGLYEFAAEAVEEVTMVGDATHSHAIPSATQITSPAEDAVVDPATPLQVDWTAVSTSLDDAPIEVVAYQLIVTKEEEVPPQQGFFQPTLSAHVPAGTTSVTVPAEFLESDVEYEIEVLAISDNGNQTISLTTFETQ